MNALLAGLSRNVPWRKGGVLPALTCSLALLAAGASGCSQDASPPLDPIAAPTSSCTSGSPATLQQSSGERSSGCRTVGGS